MERIVELGTLLAHYGPLLTDRQRTILKQAVWEDCSLAEIAEREGMTRQGVHDSIRSSERQLRSFDEKLGLVRRFSNLSGLAAELDRYAARIRDERIKAELKSLSDRLGKALEE